MNVLSKKKSDDAGFTREIDRQIIEGFLKDQEILLAKLTSEHFSEEVILQRAIELGLNKDFFERIKRGHVKPAARKCLRCNKYFASIGAHNRLCSKCRKE
jgi:hypothetical protein